MAANSIVYDLESAKWRQVLGKPPGLVNPWEKKLFQELMYPETITSQEIYERTTDIFRRYFGFRGHHRLTGIFDEIREKILGPFLRRGPVRMVRTDELIIARKTADGTNCISAAADGPCRDAGRQGRSAIYPKLFWTSHVF